MTSKVHQFLNESGGSNFTESAIRPPVYGEENELVSNGGVSTRSSGSHKSQLSNKSQTSSKSMGSNRGDSPAVTPRRSNKDKSAHSMSVSCIDDDDMAPLGFEPEGSASSSPPFNENSTPSFMKWAENLNYLLEDLQGVEQFRNFLDQEGLGSYAVEFWFACQGLKKKDSGESIANVIRVIHKKYIKSDKLPCISEATKKDIHEKLQKRVNLNREIFDEAQTEVEQDMRNNTYPLFIKSDLYVQYVQKGGESPKSSNTSSGSITRPVSVGPLPTLMEDQELQTNGTNLSSSVCGPPISGKCSSRSSQGESSGAKKHSSEAFSSFPVPFAPRTPLAHPYHVSYAPVSAQDSEIQSLSSDALTDDTRSIDSSVDNDKMWKRQRRAMRKRAEQNRESGIHQQFIPRTQRAPKDSNIAEVNPKKFAAMLVEKLERVLKEREKEEKLNESMNRMLESDLDEGDRSILNRSVDRSMDRQERLDRSMERSIDRSIDRSMDRSMDRLDRSLDRSAMLRNTSSATSIPLMTSAVIMDDDNPNSILEEHVSRIWESSAQQTPTRSPGRQSPSLKRSAADRKASANQTLPLPNTLPSSVHNKSFHKKRPDYHSSFDSGMGEDKPSVETHRHIHHHHHHHHSRDPKSKTYIEIEAQQHVNCWPGDVNSSARGHGSGNSETNNTDRGRTTRRANRKHSDTSSNIDSGISMIESISPMAVPNAMDPSTEKVLSWMRDNSWDSEHVSSGATGSTDTERTSGSHKRFRSGAATSTPTPHKQGSNKKSTGHGSSRSASVERTGMMQPWMTMAGQALPTQPFVQDPSMPLPTPPNTTVQLEEAKRRLEESHIVPVKSKSFTGVPSKEKKGAMFISQSMSSARPTLPTTRTVPSDLDLSAAEAPVASNSTEKKGSKKSSSSSANTSGSAPSGTSASTPAANTEGGEVIIGYFFCGEPIPYRHTVHGTHITLAQFKHLIGRRGNFKFFFKKLSNEFESEVVFEEIRDDNEMLPLWEGKIVAKVEKVD
ncbi:axin-1-like [Argopecten irradians]|uniref:axin-1-like n=1 Tax=Argopecten irradians TaxID=31199 RepID=UPI00371315CF